jgi:hypothetical protein
VASGNPPPTPKGKHPAIICLQRHHARRALLHHWKWTQPEAYRSHQVEIRIYIRNEPYLLAIPRFGIHDNLLPFGEQPLSWRSHDLVQPSDDTIFLFTTYTGPKFSRDAGGRIWEGATVTYVTLQLAYFMGFDQVVLIGVDHNFTTKGQPNTTITSQGDDPDHFNAAYFGKGFRWQLPDLETSEFAYRLARNAYEQAGRQVLDATVGGKLTVFPKVDYDTLFKQPQVRK